MDHTTCPPSAHDFDPAGTTPAEQRRDAQGRRRCNGCGALCFYCTRDEDYHHAPGSAPPCFLVQEQGWDVPAPASVPVPVEPAGQPRHCHTCGYQTQGPGRMCGCWCLLADALQRYLGIDHDSSAQMAADLWRREADRERVWSAEYARDHFYGETQLRGEPIRTYPPEPVE